MAQKYNGLSQLIHWLTAGLIAGLFYIGWGLEDMAPSPDKLKSIALHKSLGICVLTLVILRILWLRVKKSPAMPVDMPRLHVIATHAGHGLLYLAMLCMPLAGWINSSAKGYPVVVFGMFQLPAIAPKSELIAKLSGFAHHMGATLFIIVIGGHVAAALWHQFVMRDRLLARMLPFLKPVLAGVLIGGAAIYMSSTPQSLAQSSPTWQVDYQKSSIKFIARQMGVPVEGYFENFKTDIVFDPTAPENAKIDVKINMTSVKTGTAEVNNALPGAEFFDSAGFAEAHYQANGFKPLGNNQYRIDGKLTLKGMTQELPLEATIKISPSAGGNTADAQAQASLSRTTYKVGTGQWADTGTIADEVVILIAITAKTSQ